MTSPQTCFADHAVQRRVEILENDPIARQTFRLRFRCLEIAQQFVPGQFLMLRLSDYDDPLIGRPLAIYDCASEIGEAAPSLVDVVYLAAGKMTRRLAQLQSGQEVTVWGPLGNGFPAQRTNHLIMVAGGIGQTPFLALAKEHLHVRAFGRPARDVPVVPRITLCYGARSAEFLAGLSDFERHGVEVRVSTDDGSRGHRGLVTDILDQLLDETEGDSRQIVCCGPEPMMAAVSRLAIRRRVPAQASLETPMACGIGICFSCVAEIVDDEGQADYRRTCVEGPVFAADRIRWGH